MIIARQGNQLPDEEERKEIAKRAMLQYNLPNCIAVADGTLFPLTYKPQVDDAPNYKGRKYLYSLTVMIVNDDNKRIRYDLAGYNGSVHDYRVYSNSCLAKAPWAFLVISITLWVTLHSNSCTLLLLLLKLPMATIYPIMRRSSVPIIASFESAQNTPLDC